MLDSLTKLILGTKVIGVNIAGLLMAVAFIAFLLTVINYIWKRNSGDGAGLKQAGNMLFAAVFALFVMVAVWGITEFIARNLGVGIGGCVNRPSPIPGEPAISDCSRGTASNGSNTSSGNGAATSCNQGYSRDTASGRCVQNTNIGITDGQGRGVTAVCDANGVCTANVSGSIGGSRINLGNIQLGGGSQNTTPAR